jgi:hypothetical protein
MGVLLAATLGVLVGSLKERWMRRWWRKRSGRRRVCL